MLVSELTAQVDGPALAVVRADSGPILIYVEQGEMRDLSPLRLDDLMTMPRDAMLMVVRGVAASASRVAPELQVKAPVGSQEVWAAGVTYLRSREARKEEAHTKDVYDRVYEADRPEIFFKSNGWRVSGPDSLVGARSDSEWNVPEPELAVLANARGEIVGYSCGNDMSSRSIEGENPLYLPQAKVYERSCAIGPAAVIGDVDPMDLQIAIEIERDGVTIFSEKTPTSGLNRRLEGLIGSLFSAMSFPVGAWLLTGTSIVPPTDYSAESGDSIRVSISGLGDLVNEVQRIEVKAADSRPLTAN